MKLKLFIAFASITAFAFIKNIEIKTIDLGTTCPMADVKVRAVDYNVTDTEAKSLNEYKLTNGLLVIFSCNTCPFVIGDGASSEGWEGRYNNTYDWAQKSKIGMVLINSNVGKRANGDSWDDMEARAKLKAYKMNYVLDEESALANAFGAKTTPHVFLFDKNMKLVYRGAIDDNVGKASEVKEKYLQEALTQLSLGKKIKKSDTKPIGCSIKRVAK